jgi:Zn-dependent alcohol dehydrogenase
MIASPKQNVQVVVIDIDRIGLQAISDLRLVFPNVRILALSRDAQSRLKAKQAGATAALSPASPTLGSTIESLAHPRATCGS